MSRAFVKETDGDGADELPPRPARVQPCYMTAAGIASLKHEMEQLQALAGVSCAPDELGAKEELKRRQLRIRVIARLLSEVVGVDIAQQSAQDIRFGATVMVRDESGKTVRFQIVGEDEVAPAMGRISWVSPLGRQLLGRRIGDFITWQRPAGNLELEIVGFEYPSP